MRRAIRLSPESPTGWLVSARRMRRSRSPVQFHARHRVRVLRRDCALCGRAFAVCRACDRGHRYCGRSCAGAGRRRSVRKARRRHRASPEGRADHRDRERDRRARLRATAASVADHRSGNLTTPAKDSAAHDRNSADSGLPHVDAFAARRTGDMVDAAGPAQSRASDGQERRFARSMARRAGMRCLVCRRQGAVVHDVGRRSSAHCRAPPGAETSRPDGRPIARSTPRPK